MWSLHKENHRDEAKRLVETLRDTGDTCTLFRLLPDRLTDILQALT